MNGLWIDLELVQRVFVNRRVLAGIVALALTLTLGSGINTAILSLLDDVMLRLFPLERPYRLVVISAPGADSGWTISRSGTYEPASQPTYEVLRDRTPVFSGVLANDRVFVSDCRNRPGPQGTHVGRLC